MKKTVKPAAPTLPLVSCLCVTRNRREWLPKAIACFLAQDYENRELVIVADGEDVSDVVPVDPRIKLLTLKQGPYTLGAKRNLGCMWLDAEIVAHFDDDDYSAPGRLTDQVTRLLESGKAVTGYNTLRYTDGERSWMYLGTPLFAAGTSLVYRRDWWEKNPFPSKDVGEDRDFANEACWAHQMTAAPAGEFMYANFHEANTGGVIPVGDNWLPL
jgi:glycosyltransferase involved in cell wall biosynthesis